MSTGSDINTIRDMVRQTLTRLLSHQPVADQKRASSSEAPPTVSPVKKASPPKPETVSPHQPKPVATMLTEKQIANLSPGSVVTVPAGALVTPSAREWAVLRKITIKQEASTVSKTGSHTSSTLGRPTMRTMGARQRVALGADHGGFAMKEALVAYLCELGYELEDCGCHSTDAVDYPDFAYATAALVGDGGCAFGIIVDGAGIGSCMVANKVPGVRAALCYDLSSAKNAREHNDANVLTLGGGLLGVGLAKQVAKAFLETPFGGGRHARRVDKIMDVERRFLRKG